MMRKCILLLMPIFLITCGKKSADIKVAGKPIEVNIQRFERDIFQISPDPDSIAISVNGLSKKYKDFLPLFSRSVFQVPHSSDPLFSEILTRYLTDYSIFTIYNYVDSVFSDMTSFERELGAAFTRYHSYFPERPVPRMYSFISGLDMSFIIGDSLLGISLDKFLGSDCLLYQQAMLQLYQRRSMIPERIVPDAMKAWAITEFPMNDSVNNLLNHIIYEGSLIYFVEQMLPDLPDTLLLGFTEKQMEWCERNEKQMWTYLVEEKLLFNTEAFTIARFTQDAPFTKDFTRDSPGKAANWIGYRIVGSYMNHSGKELPELMNIRNYYPILEGSRYDP